MVAVERNYKTSEVGLVPDNWEIKPLEELCKNKGLVRGPFGGALKKEFFVKDGIKVYEQQNAIYGDINLGDYYIDIKKFEELKRFEVKPNDFIVSCSGTIGKIFLIPNDAPKGVINQALLKITTDENIVSKHFFLHYFEWDKFQTKIIDSTQGGAMKNLVGMSVFRETKFAVPSIPEQAAIATALSDVDTLIENLEKIIAKKRNIKQGAMQELLTGRKRLAGFEGNWEIKLLGDISDINTGKKNNDDKIEEGLYPFFVRSQTVERINSYSFDGEAILIPGEGNIGSIYHYINGKFDFHQRVYKISNFDANICGKYVYYCMLQSFNAHAMKNTVKATVDSLRLPTFQKFEVYLPPKLEEQKAIVTILSDIETEIEILQEKLHKYRMTKQGIMQVLLTGKIRLI